MKLTNSGKRKIVFNDGTTIKFYYCLDECTNTFYGVFRHENTGEIHFHEVIHDIKAVIEFGKNFLIVIISMVQ